MKTKQLASLIVIALPLVTLITGCSSKKSPVTQQHHKKEDLNQAQHLLSKAQRLDNIPEETANYMLQAIDAFLDAHAYSQAEDLIQQLDNHFLSAKNHLYYQVSLARIAIQKDLPEQALHYLHNTPIYDESSQYIQEKYYDSLSQAYIKVGNFINAINARIKLSEIIIDKPTTWQNNNKIILNYLNQMDSDSIRQGLKHSNDSILNGWLSFTYISKQYDAGPYQLAKAYRQWSAKYPNHAASNFVPSFPKDIEILNQNHQRKIALLLPQSGPYALTATAVRDGFLASYYNANTSKNNNDVINIYDTTQIGGVNAAYSKAEQEQNHIIIGPLVKEELDNLIKSASVKLPTIALNISSNSKQLSRKNLIQFGLSPEQEIQTIVEKIIQERLQNGYIIAPSSDWGQRMRKIFEQKFIEGGGKIVANSNFNKHSDINQEIKSALHLGQSEKRASRLKDKLQSKFSFIPRRRQDIDFIFLIANSEFGRQVKPMLNFHYAANIPVYSTSSIYQGIKNKSKDQDLNGIQFLDIPWVLNGNSDNSNQYSDIKKLWPDTFNGYSRLYALGMDAYKLYAQHEQLTVFRELGINGVTGVLTIDENNIIKRKLTFAKFINGTPKSIADSSNNRL